MKIITRTRTSFNMKPEILEMLNVIATFENETMSQIVNKSVENYIMFRYPKIKEEKEKAMKELETEDIRIREKVAEAISNIEEKRYIRPALRNLLNISDQEYQDYLDGKINIKITMKKYQYHKEIQVLKNDNNHI